MKSLMEVFRKKNVIYPQRLNTPIPPPIVRNSRATNISNAQQEEDEAALMKALRMHIDQVNLEMELFNEILENTIPHDIAQKDAYKTFVRNAIMNASDGHADKTTFIQRVLEQADQVSIALNASNVQHRIIVNPNASQRVGIHVASETIERRYRECLKATLQKMLNTQNQKGGKPVITFVNGKKHRLYIRQNGQYVLLKAKQTRVASTII